MCGIVGALTFGKMKESVQEKMRTEALIFLTTQLLQATVERGKDATGMSLLWENGMYTGLKMGIPSPDFIARFGGSEKDYEGILKLWREYPHMLKVYLGHCRKASKGNSYDNKNNHPIQVGNIILVHNGTLQNEDVIFEKLGCQRDGEVDTEAIARLLHHYTDGGKEPFTREVLEETTKRIRGTYSVLAVSGDNPNQVIQFRDGKPAEVVLIRPLKTVLIASDDKFLKNILFEFNKMAQLFASGLGLPYLKKADVEWKSLPDDSGTLWDLTTEVDEKTELGDLYDWYKTPTRANKIWNFYNSTTSYNNTTCANNGAFNRHHNSYYSNKRSINNSPHPTGVGVNAASVKNSEPSSDNNENENEFDGLVWSRRMNKYKTQTGMDRTKEFGQVLFDVEKGEVNLLDSNKEEGPDLVEVGPEQVESLIDGGSSVKELALDKAKLAVNEVNSHAKKNSTEPTELPEKPSGVKEVDMSSNPEALKRAEDFAEKSLSKYEKDDEVISDLGVTDVTVLKSLPLFALANRINKFCFKRGFYTGYVSREQEEEDSLALVTLRKKESRAKNRIKILKIVVKILTIALRKKAKDSQIVSLLDKAIEEVKSGKTNWDMAGVFTAGDLRDPVVKTLNKAMVEAATKE